MTQELIAVQQQPQQLMRAIATPKELIAYHEDMTVIIRDALKDGVDYGLIPKTKKPTLYKAGAERINIAFGTHPEYELVEKEIDHNRENSYTDSYSRQKRTSEGLYRYVYKCKIVKNSDGKVIGEGQGVCSTLESKYISRPRDSENTACKMAQKRAFMAATLHAFGLSDRFTQDVEDMHEQAPPQVVASSPKELTFDRNKLPHVERLRKEALDLGLPELMVTPLANRFHGQLFTRDTMTSFLADTKDKFDAEIAMAEAHAKESKNEQDYTE